MDYNEIKEPVREEFLLREEHIKLINAMWVGWQNCEYGAPEIDPKRPYGNSDVANDIAEILGWSIPDYENREYNTFQKKCRNIHLETEKALQIVLSCKTFEPGVYRKMDKYDSRSWQKLS